MRTRLFGTVGLFGLMAACTVAAPEPPNNDDSVALLVNPSDPGHLGDYAAAPDTGAHDQGGPIMNGDTTVYLLFYGESTEVAAAQRQQLLKDFMTGLDGSALANVLTSYSDGSGHRPTGHLTVKSAVWPTRNLGNNLNEDLFEDLILGVDSTPDANTIYAIIGDEHTTADLPSGAPICASNAAAWHNFLPDIGAKYEFILDANACGRSVSSPTPNNDPFGDAQCGPLWHETAEAITDPEPKDDPAFMPEIADMCEGSMKEATSSSVPVGYAQVDYDYAAPIFGMTGSTANANVHLGARDFKVQPIWQDVQGGGCVRRMALNRPSINTIAHYHNGDFDFDGVSDLLFQNTSTGQVYYRSLPSDDAGASGANSLGTAPTGWFIYGVADFMNEGKANLLWRDQVNGTLSIWHDGTATHISGNTGERWAVRGVGDFDGNGAADIFFLNMEDNTTRLWLNDGTLPSIGAIEDLPATGHPTASENADVVGVGDFDFDGRADILWKISDAAGDAITSYRYWHMNGTSATGHDASFLTGYDVLGLADINGFGHAVAIASRSGQVYAVDVQTGVEQSLHPLAGTVWRFAGSGWIDGVGATIYWVNRMNGSVHRWVFDFSGDYQRSEDVLDSPTQVDQVVAY